MKSMTTYSTKKAVATWPDGTPQTRHSHTRRQIMQIFGTDVFRDMFDQDFWVRKLVSEIESSSSEDPWVISDCRFLNEFEALQSVFDRTLVIQLRRKGGSDAMGTPMRRRWSGCRSQQISPSKRRVGTST